jgi:hypothetical protein
VGTKLSPTVIRNNDADDRASSYIMSQLIDVLSAFFMVNENKEEEEDVEEK